MQIEPSNQKKDSKLKMFCLGSAEINQFYIPYDQSKRRQSTSRRPICLSQIKEFLIINEEEDDQTKKESIIKNPLVEEKIMSVACGGTHTLLNTAAGRVYSWGSNDQLALGRDGDETVPQLVDLDIFVDMISAGDAHSVFANSENGIIYFCGSYRGIQKGFLGQKVKKPIALTVEQITLKHKKQPEKLKKVVSGYNHTLLLIGESAYIRGDTQYFASGRRILERRKDKFDTNRYQGLGIKHVVDVFTGGMHCFLRTRADKYYGWGNNAFGQLGIGNRQHQPLPVEIDFFEEMDLVNIVGGQHHSVFLARDGNVYACGKNDNGQVGLGEDLQEDHQVHKPERKSARKSRKRMQSPMKIEKSREASQQGKMSEQKPDSVASSVRQGLGQLLNVNFIWLPRKLELQNIKHIASGPHFSFAVADEKSANNVYSWGLSSNYVLINGSQENDKYTPYTVLPKVINYEIVHQIAAGAQHVVFLSTTNKDLKIQYDQEEQHKKVYRKSKPLTKTR